MHIENFILCLFPLYIQFRRVDVLFVQFLPLISNSRLTMASLVKQFSGRKRESPVWDYFEELECGKCKCVALTKENGKICGQLINGKNATNLKVHLQTHHTESFKEFVGMLFST